MQIYPIGAYYFPTRILLVDDKISYLKSLESILDQNLAIYEAHTDQHQVLVYLLKDYQPEPTIEKIVTYHEQDTPHAYQININLNSIHQIIYNPNRFAEISILAIDHSMPGITGSEICEKLKDRSFMRLMLTGEADNKLAIDLLNRKIINHFINKANTNFAEIVNDTLHQLQKEYFSHLSKVIIDNLINNRENPRKYLKNNHYLELFSKLCVENKVVEYYLLDNSGSYLFISATGKLSYFVVRSETDMQDAEKLAQSPNHNSTEALLALKKREKLLFLPSNNNQNINWQTAVYPAKSLNASPEKLYYSYITDPKAFNIDSSKVSSFRQYAEGHS